MAYDDGEDDEEEGEEVLGHGSSLDAEKLLPRIYKD